MVLSHDQICHVEFLNMPVGNLQPSSFPLTICETSEERVSVRQSRRSILDRDKQFSQANGPLEAGKHPCQSQNLNIQCVEHGRTRLTRK